MNIFFNDDEARIRAGWRIAAQFFLMILIGLSLTVALSSTFGISGNIISTFLMACGAVISIYLAARGLDKRSWGDYGVKLNREWALNCGFGFLLAGLAMAAIFVVEYAAGWLTITNYGWEIQQQSPDFIYRFAGYLGFMILVGFYEEFVFRGYQIVNMSEGFNLPDISRSQAVWGSVAFSSLIFGAAHAINPNAGWISTLNISLAGAMLALPFVITGNLSYSVGLHIGWNFFQGGIFGYPVSGVPGTASLLRIQQNGPEWLTGGAFGPEAGIMGLLGMTIIILGLFSHFNKSHQPFTVHKSLGDYKSKMRNHPA